MSIFKAFMDFFFEKQKSLEIKVGHTYKQDTAQGEISYFILDIKENSVVYERTQSNGKTKTICEDLNLFKERKITDVLADNNYLNVNMLII